MKYLSSKNVYLFLFGELALKASMNIDIDSIQSNILLETPLVGTVILCGRAICTWYLLPHTRFVAEYHSICCWLRAGCCFLVSAQKMLRFGYHTIWPRHMISPLTKERFIMSESCCVLSLDCIHDHLAGEEADGKNGWWKSFPGSFYSLFSGAMPMIVHSNSQSLKHSTSSNRRILHIQRSNATFIGSK